MGLILTLIGVILSAVLYTIAIPYTWIKLIFKSGGFSNWWKNLQNYYMTIAISIDQTGNTICSTLFNDLLLKNNPTVNFGNEDDTISYVLGAGQINNDLTYLGWIISAIIDSIDPIKDPTHCYRAYLKKDHHSE